MVLYVIWTLLPLTLFLMGVWGVLKPYFKVYGKENIRLYFTQALFCSVGLAISIAIDKSTWFPAMVDKLSMGMLDMMVARWLLFPGVLVLMATIQKIYNKEPIRPVAPKRNYY